MEVVSFSLEGVEAALADLKRKFHEKDLAREYATPYEFRNALIRELCASVGTANVIKVRKIFSPHNYILWLVLQVQEQFVYSMIFNLIWFEDRKGIHMHKKLEEIDLSWMRAYTPKKLSDFRDVLQSDERYDYSLPDTEQDLPRFEKVIGKVSENYRENDVEERPRSTRARRRRGRRAERHQDRGPEKDRRGDGGHEIMQRRHHNRRRRYHPRHRHHGDHRHHRRHQEQREPALHRGHRRHRRQLVQRKSTANPRNLEQLWYHTKADTEKPDPNQHSKRKRTRHRPKGGAKGGPKGETKPPESPEILYTSSEDDEKKGA